MWKLHEAAAIALLFVGCGIEPSDTDGLSSAQNAITYGHPDGSAHPSVGALMYTLDGGATWWPHCSGTMVSARVFLTAGHCTQPVLVYLTYGNYGVNLNPDAREAQSSDMLLGQAFVHPDYRATTQETHDDYGVVVLDADVAVAPSALPALGQLDSMNATNGLKGMEFTAVGYGYGGYINGPGGKVPDEGPNLIRSVAVGTFASLTPDRLHISQNPATGDGGTCDGDSGGPNFIGDTNVIASITSTGEMYCRATNVGLRADTASAQSFIRQFIE